MIIEMWNDDDDDGEFFVVFRMFWELLVVIKRNKYNLDRKILKFLKY